MQIGGHVHNAHQALFRQHPAQQLFPVAVELLAVIVGVGVKYVSQKITSEKPRSGVKVFSQVFSKNLRLVRRSLTALTGTAGRREPGPLSYRAQPANKGPVGSQKADGTEPEQRP